nr:hypothetical protein [Euryarchaeota archaeon]
MAEQLRCCFLVGSATKRVEHFATSLPQERQISLLEYDLNLSILQEWESISRRFQMKWAPQVCLMRGAKPILLAVILLSMSFSSGCIGLLAGRELMEWTRGVPEREEVVDVYGFDHTHQRPLLADPSDVIFNPEPRQIRIDSEVKEMRIFFRVEMDFSEVAGFETGNFTNAVRYVDAKLWEPGANKLTDEPYWQEN